VGLLKSLLAAGSITKAVIESKERRCGGIKEEKRCRLNTVSSELSLLKIFQKDFLKERRYCHGERQSELGIRK
jgi:hypothetical protein